jgi:O-antigen/teichoic acid export membrane protein
LVAGLLAVLPDLVAVIGGGRYQDAGPASSISLVGVLMAGLFVVASLPSAMDRSTGDLAVSALTAVATAVMLNVVLAPSMGSTGAAVAIATGQGVGVMLAIWRARSHPRFSIWTPYVVAVVMSVVAASLMSAAWWELPLALRLVVVVFIVTICWSEGSLRRVLSSTTLVRSRRP